MDRLSKERQAVISALVREFLQRVESILLAVLIVVQVAVVSAHFGTHEAMILAGAYFLILVGSWWAAYRTCKRHRAERAELRCEREKMMGV